MPDPLLFSLPFLTAGVILAGLTLYVLLGGADYGGGVWDLLAFGPRTREQRALIEHAIGPVWEANHVWLIFVIVVLFTAFPPVFAALGAALHIPLTLMLIGIVLRGCAFTFRHYDRSDPKVHQRWSLLFATASLITPILLGDCIGAITTGRIRVVNGVVASGFLHPWMDGFPLLTGLFALSLFALLAAVYLTMETENPELQEDFRRRALATALLVGLLAFTELFWARSQAPQVWRGLTAAGWSMPLHALTALFAIATFGALWTRRFPIARVTAAAQTTLILWGWAAAQFPYLVPPDLSLTTAAAPPQTLQLVLISVATGALFLFPSLYYLHRVFKGGQTA